MMFLAVTTVAVLAILLPQTEGTNCYVCSDSSGCNDPYNPVTNAFTSTKTGCTHCTKSTASLGGSPSTTRTCETGSTYTVGCIGAGGSSLGGYACTCDSLLCNSAPVYSYSLSMVLAAIFAAIFVALK